MDFSLHGFKNWLAEQKPTSHKHSLDEKYLNKFVKPRIGHSKILEKIETDCDKEILVEEFFKYGGEVIEIIPKKLRIEVDSGSFTLPRFCVKLLQSK